MKLGVMNPVLAAMPFEEALAYLNVKNVTDESIKRSIETFQTISGYRDVDEQIQLLGVRLEKWYEDKKKAEEVAKQKAEEAERIAKQVAERRRIQAEKKKRAAKIASIVIFSTLGFLAAAAAAVFFYVMPSIRYKEAEGLMKAGKYEEALEIYNELGGFSASEERVTFLTGIEQVKTAHYDEGIEKILDAGVPVKITFTMNGGDFSGKKYLSVPQDEGVLVLDASGTPNVTALSSSTARKASWPPPPFSGTAAISAANWPAFTGSPSRPKNRARACAKR